MAAIGSKLIPLEGLNTDLANAYMKPTLSRFIKNFYYQLTDNAEAGTTQGSELGVMKPLPSNAIYCPIVLPAGDNFVIGTLPSRETKEVYVWVYNSESNHCIFRIDGIAQTSTIIKIDPNFNFQLKPEYFIGEGQCWLEVITVVNPDTNEQTIKKDLYWTDGFNYQGYLRTDDCIATDGFNPDKFNYFMGDYNRDALIRMGLPTPKDCIQVSEINHRPEDTGLNNNLLFQVWQFRITAIDVYGRPSEHGIITDLYIPGINDCLASSNNLARCLQLLIKVNNPLWDKIQIEYSNQNAQKDNDEPQWYEDTVLDLYVGSALGEWWLRLRNLDIPFDPVTNQITYEFCRTKECEIIPVSETTKLQPGLPKNSQAIYKQNRNIAVANNKDGFNPFPKSLKDKLSLVITPPEKGNNLREIIVLVSIYNSVRNRVSVVQGRRDVNNELFYVYAVPVLTPADVHYDPNHFDAPATFGQSFPPHITGFIGYLNDGSYTRSEQVYVDTNGDIVVDTNFDARFKTDKIFQRFTFSGKEPGNYIFRLADQQLDLENNPDFRLTSLPVFGVANFLGSPYLPLTIDYSSRQNTQELLINVCDIDYNTRSEPEILIIEDIVIVGGRAVSGYISAAANPKPSLEERMELMEVQPVNGLASCLSTDHNGFYYILSDFSDSSFIFSFRNKCLNTPFDFRTRPNYGITKINLSISLLGPAIPPPYSDFVDTPCNRVIIKGRVILQNTDIGVANATVTLTRGQQVITDDNGFYTIIAHDDIRGNGIRHDKIVVLGSCSYKGRDGQCIMPVDIQFSYCTVCEERTLVIATQVLNYLIIRSLLSGGSYGWSVNGYDWLGRKTFAQVLGYFNIPSIIESQAIGASTLTVNISPDAVFPPEIKYITFGITAETAIETYLSWIVDSVKFINNAGDEVAKETATQIKIFYGSVIEYNKQNNFNTTTAWQFIPETSNTNPTPTPVISDKVQFFINGDGQFFDKSIIALVKYAQDGVYFNIDYTTDLNDLLPNAFIRLIRPKVCTGNEPFYEICNSEVDILNQKALTNTFILNAFDTYYLPRQIPVPVPQDTDPITYINELRVLGYPFEHHSPSNFWGYQVWNRGRLNVKNPYEAEILHPNQICLSGALSPTGQLSYLQTFDEQFKTDLNLVDNSGIAYIRAKTGLILVITQYNYFIVGYGDNLARVNAQGQVSVPSGEDTFGRPERDTVGKYGCQLIDKSTVREYEGLVQWLDSSRIAIPQHNFQTCKDVSSNSDNTQQISTIKSWLTKKIQFVRNWNKTHDNKRYFIGGINPVNFSWLLTDFIIDGDQYVNEERCYDASKGETMEFDIKNKVWKQTPSFTPEYYAYLESELNGNQLFAFKRGLPYSHYLTSETDKSCDPFGASGNPARWLTERFTKKITHPGACCPPGWTRDGDTCTRIVKTPAIKNTDESFIAKNITNVDYGVLGACIYNEGFANDGTGTFSLIPTNSFWTNIPANLTDGTLNRVGIWNSVGYAPFDPVWVEITVTIDAPEEKVYYIGIAGDNKARIKVDCEDIMTMNPEAMGINHGTSSLVTFRMWHIYPIRLTKGVHYISVGGQNDNVIGINPAAFGIEVYNNTAAEIAAATGYNDLNLIFTTSSQFNQPVEAFNYSCEGGGCQNVILDNGSYVCVSTETMDIDCQPDTYTYEIIDRFIEVDPATQPKFNNFFGVQCGRVWEFVFIGENTDKKRFLDMAVYCTQSLYFADRIVTGDNQLSRLLLSQWRKGEYFSYASFLCDLNTPSDPTNLPDQTGKNVLMDGNQLSGDFIQVRLVGEPDKDAEYSEIVAATLEANKVMKSGTNQ